MKVSEDPRRIAARRAGGALYNYWPGNVAAVTVPSSFHVSSGSGTVICVTGTSIQTQPPLRPGRSFSVRDVAGVIVGPCDGSNVLYDSRNEALARFGMSEKNAAVFVQYLKKYGVPFYDLNGEPLSVGGAAGGSGECPRRFMLELRRTVHFPTWVGVGMLAAMVLTVVGLPVACCLGSQLAGPAITVVLGLSMVCIFAPWIAGAWKGELFPPTLAVDGETVWIIRALHSTRELSLAEVAELRYETADMCYILYDKKRRILAKFSTQDDFGPEFMNFLKAHNIKPRFGK